MRDRRQGIVHVIGPEQGATLPGMTVVCGDSRGTATHGAFAASGAFGIGTTEVEHVLATRTAQRGRKRSKSLLVHCEAAAARRAPPRTSILAVIGQIAHRRAAPATAIEYAGAAHAPALEHGRAHDRLATWPSRRARAAGIVAPDDKTVRLDLQGRPRSSPQGEMSATAACVAGGTLVSDAATR